MKRSYTIILALLIIFAAGIAAVIIYQSSSMPSSTDEPSETAESQQEPLPEQTPVPFASMSESDGVIYVSELLSGIPDAEVIPMQSMCFAIIGQDVYYITEGDEEFAPELRRCGTDGNNDISITEFVSPLGSPMSIGDYIYSAYYTEADGGINNGIYRYIISEGRTEKVIDGEYFIYGYDSDCIYYSTNDVSRSGTVLYKMDYSGENSTEILNFPVHTDSIVVTDSFVFFSAYDNNAHCYKIYRSPKSGNGNIDEYAFECFSDSFDVIGNNIYYQAGEALYSCEISGDNETKLCDLSGGSYAYGFLKFGDSLFYREASGENEVLYRLDLTANEKQPVLQ